MPLVRLLCTTIAVFIALLALLDTLVGATFPNLPRLTSNFSTAYLHREMIYLTHQPARVVITGDSVLWGYRVPAHQAAISLLEQQGCPCVNLAFEGGSPANTYALLRLLLAFGVRPERFVFNVNQKEFNPADSAYQRLQPALAAAVLPYLSPDEKVLLTPEPIKEDIETRIDRILSAHWKLYGMRADLRETLFGDIDAAHAVDDLVQNASGATARAAAAHIPTADRFEGTYDLDPLDDSNVSVIFLKKTIQLLRREHIPALAILTPTNHALLHDYIDVPAYQNNLAYCRTLLAAGGVRLLDADERFPQSDFLDNDHLTISGNNRLARLLSGVLLR
jgi:hypothetical protein